MRILILGASSYVGARVYSDLSCTHDVIGSFYSNQTSSELIQVDITDKNRLLTTFKKYQPELIVHIANYPSPRNAVGNEKKFAAVNLRATEFITDCANQVGSRLCFISALAAENPDNIYGKYKLESERVVKDCRLGWLIIRPSLIIGYSPNTSSDRPFNRMLRVLKGNGGISFDTSWKLQPTYLPHISQVIDQSIESDQFNALVRLFTNNVTTQYDIASDILSCFGKSAEKADLGISIPLACDNANDPLRYKLIPTTYQEIIKEIVNDIRENYHD